ncbi:MAG: type II secretion system protein M [Caulobacter sp.]|nr:type II secretion system protein M [Vitreoscilla sp.]
MSALTDTRDQWQARFAKLEARERQMVVVIGLLLAFLFVWLVFVRPAWQTLDDAPAQRAQADADLLQMQSIANEAKQLRALPPVPQSVAEQVLKAATDELGGKGKLSVQNDRAVLSLNGANGEDIRKWLMQARGGARARPIEASLTRAGDGYNGTLVVALGQNS